MRDGDEDGDVVDGSRDDGCFETRGGGDSKGRVGVKDGNGVWELID